MNATRLKALAGATVSLGFLLVCMTGPSGAHAEKPDGKGPFNVVVPKVSTDPTIRHDYDIVYVRTPRKDNLPHSSRWPDASLPLNVDAGGDLMLLHPDGSEERLVEGGKGTVTDPSVSFDGEWVYYARFEDLTDRKEWGGAPADIYKIHVKTRKVVRLTRQEFTPNTGAAPWASDYRTPEPGKTTQPYPVCNTGPCPLPGGKVIFTSNRNGFEMPRGNNMGFNVPFQLFVMEDVGYTGSVMPPPEAVEAGKVKPLTDEDRLTLVRWIDLGCPIDLDYDPAKPEERGYGWMLDDARPTLTATYPRAGANSSLARILVGMHDYNTGLDMDCFEVVADFALDGVADSQNLASKFESKTPGVWELTFSKPLTELSRGKLTPLGARADPPKAGVVVLENDTDVELRIDCDYYIDAHGMRAQAEGFWTIAAGKTVQLRGSDAKDIVAQKFTFAITTADGQSHGWTSKVVNADGELRASMNDQTLAEHLKRVQAANTPSTVLKPPVVDPPPPVVDPLPPPPPQDDKAARRLQLDADIATAGDAVSQGEQKLIDLNDKILAAKLVLVAANAAYEKAEAGGFDEVVSGAAVVTAQGVIDDLNTEKDGVQSDLKADRDNYIQLKRERARLGN